MTKPHKETWKVTMNVVVPPVPDPVKLLKAFLAAKEAKAKADAVASKKAEQYRTAESALRSALGLGTPTGTLIYQTGPTSGGGTMRVNVT